MGSNPNISVVVGAGILFLLTLLAYAPALGGGFFWDDTIWIVENPMLGSFKGLLSLWQHPRPLQVFYHLTATSFWLEHQIWGLNAFGYHLDNILLHITNAFLLWALLSRLKAPGAWLAAGLFALHPVHVDSVAWISERKNVLSLFFSLAAMLAYLRRADWRFYFLALGFFFCGFLSKSVICMWPLVALILLGWKEERLGRREVLLLLPFFALSFGFAAAMLWDEKHIALAEGGAFALSFWERCQIAGRAVWFYLGKFLWPANLLLVYPRWKIQGAGPQPSFYFLSVLAILAALWALRKRIGKAPFAGFSCFLAMLFPVLGFFNVSYFRYTFVANPWQYHADIGLIALLAAGLTKSFKRKTVGLSVSALLVLFLGFLTWQRVHLFKKDEISIWRETVQGNPSAAIPHYNLGTLLKERGDLQGAASQLERAIALDPDYAEAHNNLAVILTGEGKPDEAIEHLERALRVNPNQASVHTNLGIALAKQGRLEEANRHFAEAVRLEPQNPKGYYNLKLGLGLKSKLRGE